MSASTPEQRLTELESLVSTMQSEILNLQAKVESASILEERIAENEHKITLLTSEVKYNEVKFDFSHKF